MKHAIVRSSTLHRLQRWDAAHVIACVEHGGDPIQASRTLCATDKLRELIGKAEANCAPPNNQTHEE